MNYLFNIDQEATSSLFATGTTTLFHTSGTSLFWTNPSSGRSLDNTWEIVGMSVSPSLLQATYSETSKINIPPEAVLYFAPGTFANQEELIATAQTSTTLSIPFTNPDPSPNPSQSPASTIAHPELNNLTFSACYSTETNYSPIFTATASGFSVGTNYLNASINLVESVPESNRFKFELKVDTTYNDGWYSLASSIFNLDYIYTDALVYYQNIDNPLYSSETLINTNAGGQTSPYTRQFRAVIQDAVADYYYGNYAIVNFEILLINANQNLTDIIGNPTLTITNPGNFQFYNNSPTLTNQTLIWKGVSDFEIYDDRITIIKSGTWTSPWYFKRNGGTTFSISGTTTTIFTTNTNGDVIELIQPFSGSTITKTYLKSLSVSYTNNPPTSYTADLVLVGVPLPATIDIKSGVTTITSITQTSQTQTTGDLRTLGVYGLGVVSFEVDTLSTNFDASYFGGYSGSEIQGYSVSTAENNPNEITWSFNGTRLFETAGEDLYFGDYPDQTQLLAGATPDATSFTTTYTDSDFVSPSVYTADTPIPAVNKSGIRAVLYDTTQNIQSPLYVGSASKSVSDDYFTSDFGTFYNLDTTTNLLTCRIAIQTAFNTEWRLLGSAVIRLEYDDTIIQPSSTTAQLYEDSGDAFGDSSGIQRYRVIPVGTAKAGTFDLIDIVFKVFATSDISTALSVARLTSIKDETDTEYLTINQMNITNANFFWVGINDFTFTGSSITIVKNAQGSYTGDWSFKVNGGRESFVPWSDSVKTGLFLSNGDIVEVIQPINGTSVTKTLSGIVVSGWSLANPTFPSSNDILALSGTYDNPQGICVHPNGSSVGIFDDDGGTHVIAIYNMVTAFDIAGASNTPSNTLSPIRTNGRGIFIDENNGYTFYTRAVTGADKLCVEIPQSTTSNWSLITFNGVFSDIIIPQGATNIANVKGLTFYGGNRCVICGQSGSTTIINIYDFSLSTTPSVSMSLSLINQYSIPSITYEGLDAKPDGTKLYAIDGTGDIYEHDISNDILNTTPTNTKSLSTILGGSYPSTSNWVGLSIDRTSGASLFVVNGRTGNLNSEVFKITL